MTDRDRNIIEALREGNRELRAEVQRLTDQMNKLAHFAHSERAQELAECYLADWDALRADHRAEVERLQAKNKELLEALEYLLDAIDKSMSGVDGLHTWQCGAPDHGRCSCDAYAAYDNARKVLKGAGL